LYYVLSSNKPDLLMEMKYVASAIVITALISVSMFLAPEQEVYTVDEVLNKSGVINSQNISIRGKIVQGPVTCTQRMCGPEDQCCNTCSGPLELEGYNSSLVVRGHELGCSGTSCELNCTPTTGKEYVFQGHLKQNYGQISLEVENYREVEE
jgi:hypothetical protein